MSSSALVLPDDVWTIVLEYLHQHNVFRLGYSCRTLQRLCFGRIGSSSSLLCVPSTMTDRGLESFFLRKRIRGIRALSLRGCQHITPRCIARCDWTSLERLDLRDARLLETKTNRQEVASLLQPLMERGNLKRVLFSKKHESIYSNKYTFAPLSNLVKQQQQQQQQQYCLVCDDACGLHECSGCNGFVCAPCNDAQPNQCPRCYTCNECLESAKGGDLLHTCHFCDRKSCGYCGSFCTFRNVYVCNSCQPYDQ